MSDYVKLAEPPTLELRAPTCSACSVDLISEDGWMCPVCGTCWSYNDGDGDAGELYEAWSGETLDGDSIDSDAAFQAGVEFERREREAVLARFAKREADRLSQGSGVGDA